MESLQNPQIPPKMHSDFVAVVQASCSEFFQILGNFLMHFRKIFMRLIGKENGDLVYTRIEIYICI